MVEAKCFSCDETYSRSTVKCENCGGPTYLVGEVDRSKWESN